MGYAERCAETFLILCICGIVGVGIDLDHVITLIWRGLEISPYNLSQHASRFLHKPILLVSGSVCIFYGTRLARLLLKQDTP